MRSMFGKGASGSGGRKSGGGTLSLIGADVRIVGNIVTDGEIQIDGRLEGDILCCHLLLGESGRIDGEITADTLRIHGEVVGKITASAVVIARSARITGDIVQDSVEIEAGAQLEGRLIRKTPRPPEPAAEAAPALAQSAVPARLAPPRKDKAPAVAAAPVGAPSEAPATA